MEEEIIITFGKSKKPMKIKHLLSEKNDNIDISSVKQINVKGNVLSYMGYDVNVFVDKNNEIFFKGVVVTKILNYVNSDQIIRNLVSNTNKIVYSKLLDLNPLLKSGLKIVKNDMKSIYINTAGVFEILNKSRKKEAKPFQKWVNNEVLPSIDKTGKYDMYKESKKDFEIVPNDEYQDWGLTNNSSEIQDDEIIYLGAVGTFKNVQSDIDSDVKEGEMIFKYGSSGRESARKKEHESLIDSYTCFHVAKCIKNDKLERCLRYELERRGQLRNVKFNGKRYIELFVTSPNFTIDDIKKYIDNWIDKHDHKLGANELELAKELTKQTEFNAKQAESNARQAEANALQSQYELKKLELQYKMSLDKINK